MKRFTPFVSAFLVLLLTMPASLTAEDADKFKNVEIKTIKVSEGIYMLMGEGGNIGVSTGEDGVFMIDDQFAPLTPKIKAAIASISDKPVRFVINTHWHYDHTGGNENLGKEGVLIVAHDNVYKRMSVESQIRAFGATIPASPKAALPVITFNDTMTFRLNGEEIHVFHQKNAHTDGDSVIYFRDSNVMHTGDIWANGVYPFIDASSEGSIDGMIRTVSHLLTLVDDNTKFIPGHGPLGNRKELEGYLQALKAWRSRMQKLIDEGRSIDEIVALKPLADYDETHGKAFLKPEQFLRVLHDSMSR